MIKILIADDHTLFRQIISDVLDSNPDFRVIAQCGNSEEAIGLTRSEKPDIVLMDINIKPFTGIQATEQIKAQSFSKVVGLSMHSHPSYAKQMMRAGATGYVTKNSATSEIFTAVREAAKGNKYICSEIKTIISDEMMSTNGDEPSVRSLTEREMQIIHLIRDGLSSKEIAGKIGVTLKTVEVHRHNILKKLKIKNSSMLVSYMYSNAGLM